MHITLYNPWHSTLYRLFLLPIIHHLQGKPEVFSTFYVNGLNNLSHKFNVCRVEVNTQMKVNENEDKLGHYCTATTACT